MNQSDVLVIGAGISGLLCATELQKAGLDVQIVDKGRGVGGRMATRRMSGGRIDHGAQFFTVRDNRFRAYVREWLDLGVVREWYRNAQIDQQEEDHIRYCGVSGMSDAPKQVASILNVHCSQRIQKLLWNGKQWNAMAESGDSFCARELVITAPLPQALQLLETTGLDYAGGVIAKLRDITYAKGLALLAILDGPSGLQHPGVIKPKSDAVEWIADNSIKGICPSKVVGITVQATRAYAEKYWEAEDAVRAPAMLQVMQDNLQSRVVEYRCHRWGFTHPLHIWKGPTKCFRNPEQKLTLAGDAFGGPRVESAALSGLDAAVQILGCNFISSNAD